MSKREAALATLVSLPEVDRIAVVRLQPGDVVVLECNASLTEATLMELNQLAEGLWPDHKVVILADGVRFKVLSEKT